MYEAFNNACDKPLENPLKQRLTRWLHDTVFDDKPMLNVMLSDDMVKDHGLNAGLLVREAAKLMQGGGGGQPHFASAGGKNPDGLSAAIDKVIELCNL